MWQNFINGILGILLIITMLLGFPPPVKNIFAISAGCIIAILSFWPTSKNSSESETKNESQDANIP